MHAGEGQGSVTVGLSSRTPSKHDLLRRVVGREAGVVWRTYTTRRYRLFDLTAGDGVGDGSTGLWERDSSPGILAHHAAWLGLRGVSAHVLLTERASATFTELMDNLLRELPIRGWEQIGEAHWVCGMAELEANQLDSLELAPEFHPDDIVFANNDPNTIKDWAFPPLMVQNAPRMITTLSTLGCNVGGLKRLDEEERLLWFEHVRKIEGTTSRWHDVVLANIDRDPAQWAYCLSTPSKWREQVQGDITKAFAPTFAMNVAWRSDGSAYRRMQDELFRTSKERQAIG